MGDHLRIEQGSLPWRPGPGADLVEVLHRYTHPLIGVIEQSGHQFLFWCVVGETFDASIWIYARLEAGDLERLQRTKTAQTLADTLRKVSAGRGRDAVFASEDSGIMLATSLDDGMTFGDDPLSAVHALKRQLETTETKLNALRDTEPAPV